MTTNQRSFLNWSGYNKEKSYWLLYVTAYGLCTFSHYGLIVSFPAPHVPQVVISVHKLEKLFQAEQIFHPVCILSLNSSFCSFHRFRSLSEKQCICFISQQHCNCNFVQPLERFQVISKSSQGCASCNVYVLIKMYLLLGPHLPC